MHLADVERHYMKPRTAKSMELYDILIRRGYLEPFCDEITKPKYRLDSSKDDRISVTL